MDFLTLVAEIKELRGLDLQSIRKGANITLMEVSDSAGTMLIKDAKGRTRNRSLAELQKIWNELSQRPAVHVDSVLGGSGSSRNQPETLLANLPFVEYLIVNGRKFIALVAAPTHNSGTIKQMDLVLAESVRQKLSRVGGNAFPWTVVFIAKDFNETVSALEATAGRAASTVTGEHYARQFNLAGTNFLVIGPDADGALPLQPGVYPVLQAAPGEPALESLSLCGTEFRIKYIDGAQVLLCD